MADGGSRRKPRMNPQHDAEKHIQRKTDKAGLREVFVSSYKGQFFFNLLHCMHALVVFKVSFIVMDAPLVWLVQAYH